MNIAVAIGNNYRSRGLRSVLLDFVSVQLSVFDNASFASNKNNISQLGYVVALADKSNIGKHYSLQYH